MGTKCDGGCQSRAPGISIKVRRQWDLRDFLSSFCLPKDCRSSRARWLILCQTALGGGQERTADRNKRNQTLATMEDRGHEGNIFHMVNLTASTYVGGSNASTDANLRSHQQWLGQGTCGRRRRYIVPFLGSP